MINLSGLKRARLRTLSLSWLAFSCLSILSANAQTVPSLWQNGEVPTMIGIGDSIGEGVQSADASWRTQPFGYLSWLAHQIGAEFDLPLITSSLFGVVGDPAGRPRLMPFVAASNLAVSGADVDSLLNDRADAIEPEDIDSEIDLVLFPRLQSQIEIAESAGASLIVCWIGNNDVLSAVTSFDELDASQMTPIADFENAFVQIVDRLHASASAFGTKIVFANIADVSTIGFLLDRVDLVRLLGQDFGLPEGHFTTIVAMFLIRLGLDDGSILQNPSFVLDAQEVALIRDRIRAFNDIIQREAGRIGMPVLDINSILSDFTNNPPVFSDITLSPRFLRGFFSLDGVHPSNIGHALLANEFIGMINAEFQTNVPQIDDALLNFLFLTDPSIDKDGDNRATGRPFAGLLETLGPSLGISGDSNDFFHDAFLPGARDNRLSEPYIQRSQPPRWQLKEGYERERENLVQTFRKIFGQRTSK